MDEKDLAPVTRIDFEMALDGVADALEAIVDEIVAVDPDAKARLFEKMFKMAQVAIRSPAYAHVASLMADRLAPEPADPQK